LRSRVSWLAGHALPGRLGLLPRPYGDEGLADDIANLREQGVEHLVSCLASDEAAKYGLAREGAACLAAGVRFSHLPILDRHAPPEEDAVAALVADLVLDLQRSGAIAVHCFAGIGRSATILALVLVESGFTPKLAFECISRARGCLTPDTPAQLRFVQAWHEKRRPERPPSLEQE
jgi:protein-tyrosine phosphatase